MFRVHKKAIYIVMLQMAFFRTLLCLSTVKMSTCILHPEIVSKMEEHRLVPDFVPDPPKDMCTVIYPPKLTGKVFPPKNEEVYPLNQNELIPGNIVHEDEVKLEPYIFWEYHPNKLYTLCFTTPDGAKYEPPLVWLTVNIPGVAISEGQNVTDYQSPKAIVKDQRYVFLVYEQPRPESESDEGYKQDWSSEEKQHEQQPLVFDEFENRDKFSAKDFDLKKFTQKYKLKNLIAANFFRLRH